MEVLSIHISAFIVTIFFVVISDLHALCWVLGFFKKLPKLRMQVFHGIVSAGLTVSILSGFFLFWPERAYLLTDTAFQVKLLLVVLLVLNAWVIHKHMQIAFVNRFRATDLQTKIFLITSGLVSTGGWIGTFFAARAIGI